MPPLIDLTGQQFGSWNVLYRASDSAKTLWYCRCVCGKEKNVGAQSLREGSSTNCGCLRRYTGWKVPRTTHGAAIGGKFAKTYRAWRGMRARVSPNSQDARYYADRGITICERWSSYPLFREDMGECQEGLTLERINNNKGYEPDNCRWATLAEQQRNSRNCRPIIFRGKTQLISDWARDLGVGGAALNRRLKEWPLERALTEPIVNGGQAVHQAKNSDDKSLHAVSIGPKGGNSRSLTAVRDGRGQFTRNTKS